MASKVSMRLSNQMFAISSSPTAGKLAGRRL